MSNLTNSLRPFHLAFPVKNIKEAKRWYTDILGCNLGRESKTWIDFNFFGHQVVAHLVNDIENIQTNPVDDDDVPCRHFGIILDCSKWEQLRKNLIFKKVDFIIDPNTRFKDSPGEQKTMFISDPSGNALEFKCFKNDNMIFET